MASKTIYKALTSGAGTAAKAPSIDMIKDNSLNVQSAKH